MNVTPLLLIVLLVAGVILVTNLMIAIAWFRDPRNRGQGQPSRDERTAQELHQRVEKLRGKKD